MIERPAESIELAQKRPQHRPDERGDGGVSSVNPASLDVLGLVAGSPWPRSETA